MMLVIAFSWFHLMLLFWVLLTVVIWPLPTLLCRLYTWYLEWKFGSHFRVQRVGYLSFHGIRLLLPSGSVLELEHLWLSSCALNQKYKSLLTLCVSDLRFQGDFFDLFKALSTKKSSSSPKKSFDPTTFLEWIKFLRISLFFNNASAMQFGNPNDECLFHTTLQDLELYMLPSQSKVTHEVEAIITSLTLKVFKHYHSPSHSCLAQLSLSSSINAILNPSNPPLLSDIKVSINQPEIFFYNKIHISPGLFRRSSVAPTEEGSSVVATDHSQQILSHLPTSFAIELNEGSLNYLPEDGQNTFTTNLKAFSVALQFDKSPDVKVGATLQGLSMDYSHLQILSLLKLDFITKFEKEAICTSLTLSSFQVSKTYDNILSLSKLLPIKKSQSKQKSPSFLQRFVYPFMENHLLKFSVELRDTKLDLKISDNLPFYFNCNHAKFTASSFLAQNFSDISTELLLENTWCFISNQYSTKEGFNPKKCHAWMMPLALGVILIHLKQYPTKEYRVESMVDNFQLEWSPIFCSVLKKLLALKPTPKTTSKHVISTWPRFTFQISFSNVNLFFLIENSNCLMVRTDNIYLDTHKHCFSFEGLKLIHMSSTNSSYIPCVKSSEIKTFNLGINAISITLVKESKEYAVQILDEIEIKWTTGLHMTIFTLINENPFKLFGSKSHSKKSDSSPKFNLFLQGPLKLNAVITRQYALFFHLSDLNIHKTPFYFGMKTEQLKIGFNDDVIFEFQQFKVVSNQENEEMLFHRKSFPELETKHNKIYTLDFEEIKVNFPYQFNFAEAFTERTLAIIKWLKMLHSFQKSHSLPSDVVIKIRFLSVQLPDDPFEVKLRDNFVLLKDEYNESLERKRMLNEQVEKRRKNNLLLPSGKVEELYASLLKKNADIYIQRSKQLYDHSPMRTSLLLWTLENLQLVILSDSSFHCTEKVIKTLKEIDPDSPYPEEGLEFDTLWCRMIRGSFDTLVCQLRNFPQPYIEIRELHIWGKLCGAEQAPTSRSKRLSLVEIPEPWSDATVERNMCPLKFYHDLKCDMHSMCAAYGPCWEPVMTQVSLAFEYISRPSLDPSPTLPFWDKVRLLFHGRMIFSVQHLIFFLHASLDPYNTTEEMEISWSEVIIDWTNAKIQKKGDLDIYVHTASKYDDCRLLHMPKLKLVVMLDWLCLGNPNDHHSVTPCAPDKVPEYSINQIHDSYRAFRSQHLSLGISLESKIAPLETADDIPTLLLYSSTLKWFENLKMILSGVTRLTRKGKLFNNTKPRKPQLSRHYKTIRLFLNLHKSQICYWTSFAKHRGLELLGGRLLLNMEYSLSLVPPEDNLIRRPQPVWNAEYMNCELGDSEMWLFNCQSEQGPDSSLNRTYFFSVNQVSYGREAVVRLPLDEREKEDNPIHRLVVHGLKGAWTKSNRDVIFSLYDSYNKGKQLKRNLATDALKGFKVENSNFSKLGRSHTNSSSSTQVSPPCATSQADQLLQKLLAEADGKLNVVYTEERDNTVGEQPLLGVSATKTNDVLYKNWLIELVNSQVMLKGTETSGYVIVSASKTQILQKIHQPTWKERTLYSKTSWVGSLECMQYYATVDAGEPGPSIDNIMWLSLDNIEERESLVIANIPDLVGSGHSVGGIVSSIVGGSSDSTSAPLQLQRIVFRCGCQFYYVSYGQNFDEHNMLEFVPPPPEDNVLWDEETCVDAFTLTHHDLDISTNSLQYAMILDIVNNLLLYVEPRIKEAQERLQRMRFQLQLCSIEDQRKPILQLQNQVRTLLCNLKALEKEAYQIRLIAESSESEEHLSRLIQVENEINKYKEQLNDSNDELTMMINCYKETQMHVTKARKRLQEQSPTTERHHQVCFTHARWKLTDKDGQLGLADLVLNNFMYSKVTKSNGSVEHLLELGYIRVNNLLPNQVYSEVLYPTEFKPNAPQDRQRALRIFCRENAVGFIPVKEHLEVNIVPITLSFTKTFYIEMMKFFFPGRDADKSDTTHADDLEASGTLKSKKRSQNLPTSTNTLQKNDIEKMKERAKNNHTFLYIKITEVPIRLSYKGDKIKDLPCVGLVFPTLEYHNRTWTWLDLLMELKGVAKKILLPQAIKQKFLSYKNTDSNNKNPKEEEDKATLLFGTMLRDGAEKSSKKKLFAKLKRSQ